MNKEKPIILASASITRRRMMRAAGVSFIFKKPRVDEGALKKVAIKRRYGLRQTAEFLAKSKAESISRQFRDKYVVGADQVLGFRNKIIHKPQSVVTARKELQTLSGKKHQLITSTCVFKDGKMSWKYISTNTLYMHKITKEEINKYLKEVGKKDILSVGIYQIEGPGIRLFTKIEGDFFSILGLSLVQLLNFLRKRRVI